jgi:hypothetical protein
MNPVIKSAAAAMLSLSFSKSMLESMMRWDFKEGSARENLMQLCFSSLGSWFIILLTLVVSVLPPELLPLHASDQFSDYSLVHFMLNGYFLNMIAFAAAAFVLTWLFRFENILLLIIALLVKFSWLHINSAVAGVLSVLLSALCYRWWAVMDIKSEARRIWNSLHQIQMISFLVTFSASLYFLDFVQLNGLFSEHGFNRVQFLAALLAGYYALNFLMMSVFGHFYFHRKIEPQHLQVYFSTANWILRFRFKREVNETLRKKAETEIVKHQDHLKNFIDLKTSSPGLATLPIENVLLSEIDHLKEAILRFSKV